VDLYIPILTFVFGEAQLTDTGALVSTHRLRPEFYGMPQDPRLVQERLLKEAIHELATLWASALPGLPLRDERLAFRGENRFEAGYFLHGLRGRGWARLKLGAVLISGVAPGFTVCVKTRGFPLSRE